MNALPHGSTRTLLGTAVLVTALLSTAATAQDDGATAPAAPTGSDLVRAEDRKPREGTPLIANKLYPMQFRFEGTAFFDYSYADKYVQHLGGHGSLVFHVFDWLGVEGFGGYLYGDETNILEKVRLQGDSFQRTGQGQACANPGCEPELPDMWMTTWFAGAGVQWAPIYGKISAFSEVDLNFQLYTMLGGSAEGITKKLNDQSFTPMQVRPSVNYGVGLRLIPWKWMAIRLELKNFTGLNPDVEEHTDVPLENDKRCLDGYTLQVGATSQCLTDFSNNAFLQAGVSFLL